MKRVDYPESGKDDLIEISRLAENLKRVLISGYPIERNFLSSLPTRIEQCIAALLHATEAIIEQKVSKSYFLSKESIETIFTDTGTPAGFHPLISGYDAQP